MVLNDVKIGGIINIVDGRNRIYLDFDWLVVKIRFIGVKGEFIFKNLIVKIENWERRGLWDLVDIFSSVCFNLFDVN